MDELQAVYYIVMMILGVATLAINVIKIKKD